MVTLHKLKVAYAVFAQHMFRINMFKQNMFPVNMPVIVLFTLSGYFKHIPLAWL